jgi:hypothetical protein
MQAVNIFSSMARSDQRIANLENQIKELQEKKAEKIDLTHVEDNANTKSDGVAVQNAVNNANQEINNLRASVNGIIANMNNANGKYDTAINNHASDLTIIKGEMSLLNKAMARSDGISETIEKDVTHLRNDRCEKMAAEISALKERLASLEAYSGKSKNNGGKSD